MASEEAAITMMNYYTSAPPTIRNQPVFIQYSTHRELKTDNLTNQVRSNRSAVSSQNRFLHLKMIYRWPHREQRYRPSAQQQCILGPWYLGVMFVGWFTLRARC